MHLKGFPQGTLQQLRQAIENLPQREDRGRQRLATGECKQLRGQFGTALDRGNRRRYPALHIGVIRLMACQQVQVASDHLQQVVEVMGHTAGEATDGFEFL
ncbi:hypothetical protein D3C86_1154350 [compost metagenome]